MMRNLAAIPATLDATMDFRAGPPTQTVQTVTVSGQASAAQLASAGLDTTPVVTGAMQLNATLTERRNGSGELAISSDDAFHLPALPGRIEDAFRRRLVPLPPAGASGLSGCAGRPRSPAPQRESQPSFFPFTAGDK